MSFWNFAWGLRRHANTLGSPREVTAGADLDWEAPWAVTSQGGPGGAQSCDKQPEVIGV